MEEMSDRERERGGRGLAPGAGAPRDARNPACNEERERHVRCAPRFILLSENFPDKNNNGTYDDYFVSLFWQKQKNLQKFCSELF